jgi:hypothetical protein
LAQKRRYDTVTGLQRAVTMPFSLCPITRAERRHPRAGAAFRAPPVSPGSRTGNRGQGSPQYSIRATEVDRRAAELLAG